MLDRILPPWAKIAAVAVLVVLSAAAGWKVRGAIAAKELATIRTDIAKQREQAAVEARATERKQQEAINEALRKQNEKLAGINSRLAADIDRLRQRPERPAGVSEAPRPGCEGANGAELGGSHAIFLRRFAALAARYDAALSACYEALDGLI